MRKDVCRVPPARLSVTELARERMSTLQAHTAGSNNTYSTGQTVSQYNFIVPKIGVESKAETWGGEWGGAVGKVGRKEGTAEKEKGRSVGNWGKLEKGESHRTCSLGDE